MQLPRALSFLQNKWAGHAFRVGIGSLAVYLLIHTGALKPKLLLRAVDGHPWWYLSAMILYGPVLETFAFIRWYWLLREAKVDVSAGFVLRLHLMGLFFSGLLPGGTGGDFIKGFYLLRGRSASESAAALGTMVLDRFAGTFGLIWVAAICNLMSHRLWEMSRVLSAQTVTILGMAMASGIMVGVYLSPWKPEWLARIMSHDPRDPHPTGFWKGLIASLVALRETPKVFWGVIALAMMVHFSLVGVYALCAQALEVSIPFSLHAYVAPTLTMLNGIPISPAGLGIGEAGGALLYKAVGVKHGASEIPALVHSVVLLTALLCAPAYFLQRGETK